MLRLTHFDGHLAQTRSGSTGRNTRGPSARPGRTPGTCRDAHPKAAAKMIAPDIRTPVETMPYGSFYQLTTIQIFRLIVGVG
jgi:hypothetical protein